MIASLRGDHLSAARLARLGGGDEERKKRREAAEAAAEEAMRAHYLRSPGYESMEPDLECERRLKAQIGQHCLRRATGYFSYELCLFGAIRQMPHRSPREDAEAVSLGSYEKTVKGVVGRPETMVQFFGGGDACGDGAAPRRTRVDLFCGRRLMLLSVTEPDPCAYRMNVTHPLACRDGTPAFDPEPIYDPPRPR